MRLLRVKGVIGSIGFGRLCHRTFGKSATAEDDIIDHMLSMKPRPSIAAFNNKLNDFTKTGNHDTAITGYRKITSAGVKVSEFTISIMLNCFGKIKRMDHGLSLLGLTMKSGLQVDDFIITSVLNGLISESKLPEAVLFLDRIMEFVKRCPNTVMYNILLKAAYDAKDYIYADQIFESMSCQPDKITYTIMISLLLEKKMFQEAVGMLNRCLCDVNVTADSALFGSMMKPLLESKRFKDANMIIQLSIHQDTYVTANFVNVVVDYYAKRGMLKQAEAVLSFMMKRNIEPSLITYNTLLLGYCLAGKIQAAENIYSLMLSGKLDVSPDIVSATTLLKSYCSNVLLVKKGVEFFLRTFGKGNRFSANVVTYMTLIEGLFKAGDSNGALEFLSEMERSGIHVTQKLYGIVLNGVLSNGDVRWAESYFQRPENDRFNNHVVVFNILIKGATGNGRFDLAKHYVNEMQSRGLKADIKSLTPLLIALYASDRTTEAEGLVKDMKRSGIPVWMACKELKVAYRKSGYSEVEKIRLWKGVEKLEKEGK